MSVRLFAGGALALLFSVAVLAQSNERVLYVSAWDEKTRAPLTGLGVDAFAVREDDRTREVLRVSPATSPMAIAILVDNSQAARNHITEIRRALTSFVRAVEGLGPISIIGIADRPTIFTDYTTELKQLDAGIGKVFAMPGSGATLLDAIVEVSKGLGRREEDRAAIVMLTTENIEFSTRHYQDVLEELKKGGAQMHAVILQHAGGRVAERRGAQPRVGARSRPARKRRHADRRARQPGLPDEDAGACRDPQEPASRRLRTGPSR